MASAHVIYVYGNASASTEIETAIQQYSDDYQSVTVEAAGGCGYKVYMMDKKEIDLLSVNIQDYGWIQAEPKVDFEDTLGAGSDATRGTLTTGAAWQDLVTKTCDKPYTLSKVLVTFSGDIHHIRVLVNADLIAEYIVDHLVIDYPPVVGGSVGDIFKIQIQKLAGADITAVGYLYGEY